MQRLRRAAVNHVPRSAAQTEEGEGEDGLGREIGELLSAVLSAHLALFRVGVLYPWQEPFGKGLRAVLHDEIRSIAESLTDAWEFLGVTGETRREMLQQLIVEVGQQTLEIRQRINIDHLRRLTGGLGTAGDIRGSAALRETEGEVGAAQKQPPAAPTLHDSRRGCAM